MSTNKPYSPSSERNWQPILAVMKSHVRESDRCLFEVGSGTGQHGVYLSPHFPELQWHTSDVESQLTGIQAWVDEAKIDQLQSPKLYQVGQSPWPDLDIDLVFTANTLHIMSWDLGQLFLREAAQALKPGARLMIYGPFNYGGNFTSDSNASFDRWLKDRDPQSGIRDFESVCELVEARDLRRLQDHEMPANNRFLVFEKST